MQDRLVFLRGDQGDGSAMGAMKVRFYARQSYNQFKRINKLQFVDCFPPFGTGGSKALYVCNILVSLFFNYAVIRFTFTDTNENAVRH